MHALRKKTVIKKKRNIACKGCSMENHVSPVSAIPAWLLSAEPLTAAVAETQIAAEPPAQADTTDPDSDCEIVAPPPPCPKCGGFMFWWDFNGGTHCMTCEPTRRVVRGKDKPRTVVIDSARVRQRAARIRRVASATGGKRDEDQQADFRPDLGSGPRFGHSRNHPVAAVPESGVACVWLALHGSPRDTPRARQADSGNAKRSQGTGRAHAVPGPAAGGTRESTEMSTNLSTMNPETLRITGKTARTD